MDETKEGPSLARGRAEGGSARPGLPRDLVVLIFAGLVYLSTVLSPPSLMDDVDAVHAQIARSMLESGDWVTARVNGVAYLEKPPLVYWIIAASYGLLGVSDWSARLPLALGVVALCWITTGFARWAFGPPVGLYAGLVLSTCVGLYLFTRILIADALLALTITLGLWAFLRVLEEDEPHPGRWALLLAASMGTGILAKGLIGILFVAGPAGLYLLLTRQLWQRRTWQRLRPLSGTLLVLGIAAPWHVLATLANPPYLDFTPRSVSGEYHGFFWYYFLNEHVFRFLDLRYPRDYNTVPLLYFWLSQALWLFPWSVFLPATIGLDYHPAARAGRARLLALCWIGWVMVFFSFSTSLDYYTMPIYPALALLLGSAMAKESRWIRLGPKIVAALAMAATVIIGTLLFLVRGVATPGDIAPALTQNPEMYTLPLGHMSDLTLTSFAYLRTPLVMAGVTFLLGAVALWRLRAERAFLAMALMMVLFLFAATQAMVVFDPYLSSRPLARALLEAPRGQLIVDGPYQPFSSVFFYANRRALLWNGRMTNLEYGSYAPQAPDVFIDDGEFQRLWAGPERHYLLTEGPRVARLRELAGNESLHMVAESGGRFLFTNHTLGKAKASH